MMRPTYEKPEDRVNDFRALTHVVAFCKRQAPAHAWTFVQKPQGHPWDGDVFCDGHLYAYVEVKNRTDRSDKYDTWQISKSKVDGNHAASVAARTKYWLCFTWAGVPFGALINRPTAFPTKMGGRTDRGDRHDIEEMYQIPAKDFKLLAA
jgi:hypothetical protein